MKIKSTSTIPVTSGTKAPFRKLFPLASLAFVGCLLAPGHANAATIAQWSFADQGTTSNADMGASNVISGANAGALTVGSGYTKQGGQVVSGTFHTYADSAQNSGVFTDSAGGTVTTSDTLYVVGDWNDGGTGGTILPSNGSTWPANQFVNPSGSGPAGAGALYLSSPASNKNNVTEANTNNLGVTFSVTASGATLNLTDFSFYGSRSGDNSNRAWVNWHLQVDTGSGFSTLFSSAANAIPTTTWGLQTAAPFDVTLNDGESATFRLIGTSGTNSTFGRPTALDDLVLSGTVIPEPSAALLGALGLLALLRRRR